MAAITVKYFAHMRSLAGCDNETIDLPNQCSIEVIHDLVAERHPDLRSLLPHARLAHNHTFVRGNLDLEAGDEIAFIPPVSGG